MWSDIYPRMASKLFTNIICRGDPSGVYLTFDDGPDPDCTPKLLDILAQYRCKATFFVTGTQVKKHPELVIHASRDGHAIANHGYSHRSLIWCGKHASMDEIKKSTQAITSIGVSDSRLFRPPYGRFGPSLLRAASEFGVKVVLWSISTGDYKHKHSRQLINRISRMAKPGDIILMHDRGNNTKVLLEAIPNILEILMQKNIKPIAMQK